MAHLADRILWPLLTSNLRWVPRKSGKECQYDVTNLVPRMKENQGADFTQFVSDFVQAIDDCATEERSKYPEYNLPHPQDVLLDERIVQKIEPYMARWLPVSGIYYPGDIPEPPLIPHELRIVAAFLRSYEYNDCYYFYDINGLGYFNLEIVKTLIIHGEMEPILRACVHPDVGLESWMNAAQCHCMASPPDAGWDQLYEKALYVYLCLNTVLKVPELWDPAAGKTDQSDYRHTAFYQRMLRDCTAPGGTSDVITYPHRQFFGIPDDRFHNDDPHLVNKKGKHWLQNIGIFNENGEHTINGPHYGFLPFDEFLTLENPSMEHFPSAEDVSCVRQILYEQGCLPPELVSMVMRFADYEPKRTLKVPHDPFHPANREELARYMQNCGQILVNCEMMARELGVEIDWRRRISQTIISFWNNRDCRIAKWLINTHGKGYRFL